MCIEAYFALRRLKKRCARKAKRQPTVGRIQEVFSRLRFPSFPVASAVTPSADRTFPLHGNACLDEALIFDFIWVEAQANQKVLHTDAINPRLKQVLCRHASTCKCGTFSTRAGTPEQLAPSCQGGQLEWPGGKVILSVPRQASKARRRMISCRIRSMCNRAS